MLHIHINLLSKSCLTVQSLLCCIFQVLDYQQASSAPGLFCCEAMCRMWIGINQVWCADVQHTHTMCINSPQTDYKLKGSSLAWWMQKNQLIYLQAQRRQQHFWIMFICLFVCFFCIEEFWFLNAVMSCVHRQHFLGVFLSPRNDFHYRIMSVFNVVHLMTWRSWWV